VLILKFWGDWRSGSLAYLENTPNKQTDKNSVGGVVQVVVHLPSKHEALSFNSTTAKKNLITKS
jgi:hypothetical protein